MRKPIADFIHRMIKPTHVFIALMIAVSLWLLPAMLAKPKFSASGSTQPVHEAGGISLCYALAPSCAPECQYEECTEWVPGPSSKCPRPGPGGGCCLSYVTRCDNGCDDPPPPSYSPPSVSSVIACDVWGNTGWCRSNAQLTVSGADPQGFVVTITGANPTFSCTSSCTRPLPGGQGTATFSGVAATSGLTASGSRVWAYDPQPPEISTSVSGGAINGNGWYATPIVLAANAADAISGVNGVVRLSLDNGSTWQSASVNLPEGIHLVMLQAYDIAGNTTSRHETIKIDITSPEIAVETAGTSGSGDWFISSVTLNTLVSDTLSGIASTQYRINGSAWTEGSSITLPDGFYTVEFQAFDMAGNLATAAQSAPINIDTTPPVVSVATSGSTGTGGWYDSSTTLTATSSDNLSGIGGTRYRIDGGEWTDGNSVTLADGVFVVDFLVFDAAGNSTQVTQNVSVDTVPPDLTHSIAGTAGNAQWYMSSAVVTASASDLTSGIETLEYRFDGGPWQAGQMITATDGIHTIDLRTLDKAGNQTQYSFEVKVDTTAPIAKIASHANEAVIAKAVIFSGESSDALSGVSSVLLKIDDSQWMVVDQWTQDSWNDRWVTGYGMNGAHTVSLLVKDKAGNTSLDSITVHVENGLPFVFVMPTPIRTSTLIPSPTPTLLPTVVPTSTLRTPTLEAVATTQQGSESTAAATVIPTEQPARNILGRGVVHSWRLYTIVAGLFSAFGLPFVLDRRHSAYRRTAETLLGMMKNNSPQE